MIAAGNFLGAIAYLFLGNTTLDPMLSIWLLGVHFSVVPAALWPIVPNLVRKQQEGMAFAISSAMVNAGKHSQCPRHLLSGLTTIIPLGATLAEYSYSYFCWLLLLLNLFAFAIGLFWNIIGFRKIKASV
jgi:hypothetical protein